MGIKDTKIIIYIFFWTLYKKNLIVKKSWRSNRYNFFIIDKVWLVVKQSDIKVSGDETMMDSVFSERCKQIAMQRVIGFIDNRGCDWQSQMSRYITYKSMISLIHSLYEIIISYPNQWEHCFSFSPHQKLWHTPVAHIVPRMCLYQA